MFQRQIGTCANKSLFSVLSVTEESFEEITTVPNSNMSLSGKKINKILKLSYDSEKKDTGRFKIDRKRTNEKTTVLNDTKAGGRKIVAFRGTNPSDVNDIVSDLSLAVGLEANNNRFKNAKKIANNVRKDAIKEGKDSKITFVGHSLGGSLSEFAGDKKRDTIVTVNKGSGIKQINKKIGDKQTDFRSRKDAVSLLSTFNTGGKRRSLQNNNRQQLGKRGAHSFEPIKNLNIKIKQK